jgi:adenylate cyclase
VLTTDIDRKIIIFNDAAEKIFNLKREDVLGQPLRDALPPLADEFYAAIQQAQEEGINSKLELQPEIASRGRVVLELRFSPLRTAEGLTSGVTILVNDLTDLRKREATLTEVRRYLPPAMVENIRAIDTIELGGDEREISVVFADVRGFTSFSERLQPEELMEVINRYLGVSSDAIHLYEGIIDKYMGDAVVGLYNTQLNPQEEDHALRAVRAALSMLYDVQALHEVLPPSFCLWYGIGIDTGMAVLGNVGSEERKEFTALGEPLNYAKKLQESAEKGEIIISEATYERVKDRFEVERVERPFRGGTELHSMYKVLGFKRKKN